MSARSRGFTGRGSRDEHTTERSLPDAGGVRSSAASAHHRRTGNGTRGVHPRRRVFAVDGSDHAPARMHTPCGSRPLPAGVHRSRRPNSRTFAGVHVQLRGGMFAGAHRPQPRLYILQRPAHAVASANRASARSRQTAPAGLRVCAATVAIRHATRDNDAVRVMPQGCLAIGSFLRSSSPSLPRRNRRLRGRYRSLLPRRRRSLGPKTSVGRLGVAPDGAVRRGETARNRGCLPNPSSELCGNLHLHRHLLARSIGHPSRRGRPHQQSA